MNYCSSNLSGRIGRLEGRFPAAVRMPRVIRVLAGQGQEDETQRLVAAEGFDPKNGDIVITRVIVTPPDRPAKAIPPRILSRSAEHVR